RLRADRGGAAHLPQPRAAQGRSLRPHTAVRDDADDGFSGGHRVHRTPSGDRAMSPRLGAAALLCAILAVSTGTAHWFFHGDSAAPRNVVTGGPNLSRVFAQADPAQATADAQATAAMLEALADAIEFDSQQGIRRKFKKDV